MRKKILSLLLLSCLSVSPVVSAQASSATVNDNKPVVQQQDADTVDEVVARSSEIGITTANLHLRKGAGLNYGIIKTLPKGSAVELSDGVSEKYKDGYWWAYVTTLTGTRVSGWVAVKYLEINA